MLRLKGKKKTLMKAREGTIKKIAKRSLAASRDRDHYGKGRIRADQRREERGLSKRDQPQPGRERECVGMDF